MVFPLRSSILIHGRTPVTVLLILINALVFFYQVSLSTGQLAAFVYQWGIVPDIARLSPLATSMFLHGGWMHLIGNMWMLWVFGRNVEDSTGSGKFLLFYLACGVLAAVVQTIADPYSRIPIIGASGAIAGVMGGFLIKYPKAFIDTVVWLIFIFRIAVPAGFFLIYWFILQLFSGFGALSEVDYTGGGTAWFAHIGGFVAGMILIRLFPGQRSRQTAWFEEE